MVIPCGSMHILWPNGGIPKLKNKYFSVIALLLHVLAIFTATLATLKIYMVSLAIIIVFVAVTTHQLVIQEVTEIEE